MKTRHSSMRYKCSKCDKTFLQKSALKMHELHRHRTEDKNLKCNVCEKDFTNSFRLSRHIKTIHKKDCQFQCEKCSTGFKDSKMLRAHNRNTHLTHLKKVPDKACDLCPKMFVDVISLGIHLTREHNMKNEKCEQCDFASFWPPSLNRHMKIHAREKAVRMFV